MADDAPEEDLLEKLSRLSESYALYEDRMADARKRGDTEGEARYGKALKGVREGIRKWLESKIGGDAGLP